MSLKAGEIILWESCSNDISEKYLKAKTLDECKALPHSL